MERPGVQMTIQRMMAAVAIVAVLMGIAVETWRRYQLAEFARQYRLGELKIRGSERVIERRQTAAPVAPDPPDAR